LLDRAADGDHAVARTRDGALDEDDVLLGEDLHDAEVLHRDALVAVVAGHAHALERAARGHVLTDRTTVALVLVRTVRFGRGAGEVVALHDAREAAALGHARHVDELALGEDVGGAEGLTDLELGDLLLGETELANDPRSLDAGLLVEARLRLGDVLLASLPEADLDGRIAVLLGGALADDHAGAGLDRGDADDLTVVRGDLGITELGSGEAGILIHDVLRGRKKGGEGYVEPRARQVIWGSGRRKTRWAFSQEASTTSSSDMPRSAAIA